MEAASSESPVRHGQEHGEQISEETSQEDLEVDLGHVQAGDHCEAVKRRAKIKVKRKPNSSRFHRKVKEKNKAKNQKKGKADARALPA